MISTQTIESKILMISMIMKLKIYILKMTGVSRFNKKERTLTNYLNQIYQNPHKYTFSWKLH